MQDSVTITRNGIHYPCCFDCCPTDVCSICGREDSDERTQQEMADWHEDLCMDANDPDSMCANCHKPMN